MPIKPYILQSVKEEIVWKYFEVCAVGLINPSLIEPRRNYHSVLCKLPSPKSYTLNEKAPVASI